MLLVRRRFLGFISGLGDPLSHQSYINKEICELAESFVEEKKGENKETELNVLAPGTQERAREKEG